MKQFTNILKFELLNYFKNKVFVGITVFLVLVITVVMFLPRFVSFDSNEQQSALSSNVIYLKADNIDNIDIIENALNNTFVGYKVEVTTEDVDIIKHFVTANFAQFAIVMDSPTSYTYYVHNLSVNDEPIIDMINDSLLKATQTSALVDSGISVQEATDIMNTNITFKTESIGKDQVANFFYTYIMIFALYMVILLYGQMVSTNVASEKSSRAMELLITSANPTSMMFGKVLASCIAGLTQLVLVFGSALTFYSVNKSYWGDNQIIKSLFDIPVELLVYMLLFFILGFLLYAFMFGAIASTATRLEDINTSTMPIMFMFIAAFIVVMTSMASGDVNSSLMVACSYIPFTSPMAMFTRIALSEVAWYEIVTSISILICSVVAVGVLSAKIYRVGVLLYGTTPKITNILKSIWKA